MEKSGIDLEEDCLVDNIKPQTPRATDGLPPVRAIVKELASQDSGVNSKNIGKILKNIKQLNKLEIYNRDIRRENFREGKLVDFGSAWTEPHCFMHSADTKEPGETRLMDLVMFDEMVDLEGIKTKIKAMPNWGYCKKLRSQSKKVG